MSSSGIIAVLARLTALGACLMLAACGGNGGVVERFDPASGLTMMTEPELLVFARTDGRLSWSARDYVYLGPLEINERGSRTQYLWLGVGSTIDRRYLESDAAVPAVLYVDLAGAPAEFELRALAEIQPALGKVDFYEPAVRPELVLLARVTLDQLRQLAAAELPSLRLATANGESIEYRLWNEQRPWPEFAARL